MIGELAEMFDLECRIETASDPFFATVSAARTFWQRAQEVKNEIMLTIEPGPDGARRELACGSINLHGTFFGDRFDDRRGWPTAAPPPPPASGSASSAGCWRPSASTASSPKRWPAAVRHEIFG